MVPTFCFCVGQFLKGADSMSSFVKGVHPEETDNIIIELCHGEFISVRIALDRFPCENPEQNLADGSNNILFMLSGVCVSLGLAMG